MKVAGLSASTLILAAGVSALAQDRLTMPTPLSELLGEAQANNTQLASAEHGRRAASHKVQQVTTLPDSQFTAQQFSVGSPRPFAGFTNSDFAYIGFGVSQELPYPGKLRLKGEAAEREVGAQQAQADELRASLAQQVKTAYFHLAYLQQTLRIYEETAATLKEIADAELSRYRVGQGSQADVLKAQLERTKLVREITMHHAEMAEYEADLKRLLHRPQGSADIFAEDLKLTTLAYSAAELLSFVQARNPAVESERALLNKEDAQLRSVERGGKPDFNVGYMFEETGTHYRDYYVLTVGVSLPRRRRVNAEIAEAAEMVEKARTSLDAEVQQQRSDVQKQYVAAKSAMELREEYRDGLVPQAQSIFRANLAAYQAAAGELSPVLSSLGDVLNLERESAQALLDHEIAMAKLEMLTGAALR